MSSVSSLITFLWQTFIQFKTSFCRWL